MGMLTTLGPGFIRHAHAEGTALHGAAAIGDTDTVKALLKAGADIEAKYKGMTALYIAAREGQTTCVKALLDAGADIEAKDHTNGTALLNAAMIGHYAIVQTLLDAGAGTSGSRMKRDTRPGPLPSCMATPPSSNS